ncbi:hypothetical protein [Aquimarina sp. RZ0]|uniref:hypothetical protein n=1 Tax=Aquimarina sp. RZ0 TaxID=2607730 RepID=UPI0011F16649|nr:hypothetical protein [Aquimarina sp. RZ0]KAA1242626.1 hypothetical protein F0000_24720 [Aquimarina sp. RZ0]
MNAISSIINTLSPEEKRSFISLLKLKNKRTDTKNIELFKLLSTQPTHKNLDLLLYGKPSKGAFHALCKRLHDNLIDFIASKSFERESSEEMEVLKLLLASRIFYEQRQYKIALKTIKKAEVKAKTHEFFNILHEIYYTKIQYAHVDEKTLLESLIKKFKSNQLLLRQEENLNLFYASIQDSLIKKNNTQTIKDLLSKFEISVTQDLTFRSLFKILEITNQAGNINRNFHSVFPFIENTYQSIEKKKLLRKKHLFYHIQILYYVANSYFRNIDFISAEKYLDLMKEQMEEQRNKYHKRFFSQYTLLKALNLNYSGNYQLAISLLENFDYQKHKDQTLYILDLKLSLIVFYFQQSRFKEALKIYTELHHSDTWYIEKTGIIWVIKKNLIEILLHIELNNIDLIESRIKSFRKKHNTHLQHRNEHRVLEFLSLTSYYYYNKSSIKTAEFTNKIQHLLIKNNTDQEDIFTMSFYAWLKASVSKTNLYETTLQIIQQSKHSN